MTVYCDVGAEEDGREAAADDVPDLPRVSRMSDEKYLVVHACLRQYGRYCAYRDYGYTGARAMRYGWQWAFGYLANCLLFEEDGFLDRPCELEEARYAFVRLLERKVQDD
jgi:hypothetical protein